MRKNRIIWDILAHAPVCLKKRQNALKYSIFVGCQRRRNGTAADKKGKVRARCRTGAKRIWKAAKEEPSYRRKFRARGAVHRRGQVR